jgi:DNA polymerase type I|nr:MAG TPA: DNA POLYMERASE [Bacteriophage sp.]
MANEKAKGDYKHWVGAVPKIENWYKNFNFVLVESMEDLESIFKDKKDYYMAFDTETTGLDFEEIDLVGYSFCLDGKTAYYVPVYHFQYDGNLGEESVKFIYERMCEAKKVFMYNMRYDARIMEYYGYKENKADLDKRRWMYAKFDMSKVDYYDVSVPVWLADTNQKYPSLKWSSLHFLGIEQLHFDEVIENAGSFFYLNPSENEDTVFYAAADALCTFLLATSTVKYFTEAKHSAKFDNLMLYPLLHYENERIWLDGDVLKNLYIIATDRVDKMERDVYAMIGGQINLNSPVQVAQAFERLGIDTGERTSKGTMSVGIKILADLPKEYVEKFPALKSYINYKKTAKLISSYIKPLLKEYERRGYCRFAYKTTEVPTGRLACGKDGKNSFFSPINAQSLPKPHVKMEDVFDLGDRNLFSKKDNIIMGYKFVYSSYDEEGKHIIPDDPTYIGWVEGMDDDLNIRMAISPKMLEDSNDDEFLYCLDPKTSFIETKEFKYAPLFYIIEKLESGNIVHVKTPKGYRKITNYIHSGKKDAYKLVLKNGREIICSKEHSFMTDRGWLKLKDFTEDDSVIVDENMFSDVSWLPLYGYEDRYKINVHTGEMLGPDGHGSKFVRKCNTTVCSSGYAQYNVSKPGQKLKSRTRSYSVHRAILESYYESSKPFGFRVVDHIDSNKENNTIKNLQIGDNRYNLNKYSTKIKFKNGNSNPNAKHWEQYHDRVQKIIDIATRLGGFTKNLSRLISKKYGVSESYSYWVKRKMDRKENILLFKDSSNIECIIGLGYQIDMVDIEVEDEHCFYCNSILTHNCSFDYAAEELRIAANLSREPNWVDAFVHGDDIHKRTAVAIWGEEHYNRDYRKMAKYANFSILYGASSHSLYADSRYGFKSLQEAEDFYNKYKKALPTLFQWQDRLIYSARRKGMLQTFFGRPRRLRSYYENKQIGFANRSAGNTSVQGVAGDILKMVMIKLWKALFNNEEFKNDVAWRVAIHDEIGYTIRTTKLMRILKIIKETQSVKLPEWPVEIITDPSVGWSMGRVYDFHMVEDDSELGYHFEPDLA